MCDLLFSTLFASLTRRITTNPLLHAVMANVLHLLVLPLSILFAVPLFLVALFTVAASVTLLILRVALVYLDLGIALIRVHFFHLAWSPFHPSLNRGPKGTSPPRSTNTSDTGRRRGGPLTPKAEPVNPFLGSMIPDRDFEGIGGWRDENPNNPQDEHNWLNMNSRLELTSPTIHRSERRHKRALTSGGLSLTIPPPKPSMRSPGHTPVQLGPTTRMTPVTAPAFAITSPEDYFLPAARDRPQTSAEGANIGRSRRGTGSSASSVRGLQMTSNENVFHDVE